MTGHTPVTGRAVRVGAVVLAAGASTRLGRPKQLVMFDEEPLVRRAARAAVAAGARPVVVVLGAHAALISRALDGVEGVEVVAHAGWHDGMGSTLAAGLRALDLRHEGTPLDGVLLTVCDQPLVDAAALGTLLRAFDGPGAVVAAAYAGTVGVPAVVGRAHLDALRALGGDVGAGRWLRAHAALVIPVPLAAAARDIDTDDDIVALRVDGREV